MNQKPLKNPLLKFIKFVKEILGSLSVFLFVTGFLLTIVVPAHAQTATNDVFSQIENVGKGTSLPSYQTNGHALASYEDGATNITSAILYAIDFLKYIMGTIAIVTIIISGIRLVTGNRQIDEVSKKQKEHLKYAIIGLVVIMVADVFVKQVFFGEQGEIFRSQSDLKAAAQRGSEQIRGIYSAIEYFMAALAIFMIVVAGFRLVTSAGNEEVQTKSKKIITYAIVGLIILGLAEFVVKDIVFPSQGSTLPDVEKGKQLIVKLTNFIAGFVSTVSVIMYMYGGYLYVVDLGKEEQMAKAKKVFIGATIGLLLSLAAIAIVTTTVKLEPTSGAQKAGSQAPASLPTSPKR